MTSVSARGDQQARNGHLVADAKDGILLRRSHQCSGGVPRTLWGYVITMKREKI